MSHIPHYDVAVAGGGLAGLSFAIQCARAGYRVVLFEKETYPFHRVCGEYISMESWNFLEALGVPLRELQLPLINRLFVSAPNGKLLEQSLQLGGFGISRFCLDQKMAALAVAAGVTLHQAAKVYDIQFTSGEFQLQTQWGAVTATMAAGCFGKRSNLDVKWNRAFMHHPSKGLDHYIGIKYHVLTQQPANVIALHNFEQGYCGISKVEAEKYCLCYLTTAAQLQAAGNNISMLEKQVLWKNPHLKQIFTSSTFVDTQPVTIAQVSFQNKSLLEHHVLLMGDAAGMITPLCGNGMSMALHASKIGFDCVLPFLKGTISREAMEREYTKRWQQQFKTRLQTGRVIQSLFGKPVATNLLLSSLRLFPSITKYLIQQTHGLPF